MLNYDKEGLRDPAGKTRKSASLFRVSKTNYILAEIYRCKIYQ